jgi:uncharacterized protein YkwD
MPVPLRLFPLLAMLVAIPALAQDLSHVPSGERKEAARQFKIYREGADPAAREQAARSLSNMDYTVLLALVPVVERDFQSAVTNYRTAVQRAATKVARRRSDDRAFVREVAALRATLANLRAAGGALTKARIQIEGEPALNRLRGLHTIAMADLVAAQPALGPAGDAARALTRIRAMLKQKTRLQDDRDYTEADLARDETAAIARAFHRDPRAEAVLDANAALAANRTVPADEAECIRDLNEMRMLAGLAPLLIDPGLCNAARMHSQDMVKFRFFAHDSPAPGRRTPWERAKLAGTTANAENIFAGSADPHFANRNWFSSPGHHLNMFGNHRRTGAGRYERHWTQMFGR